LKERGKRSIRLGARDAVHSSQSAKGDKIEKAAMRILTDGRSEVFLGFYVIAWVGALILTHILSK
jgi:hypothetical protein